MSTLRICVVYPDLLGTYGDGGNGLVLQRRAQWRGIEAQLLLAPSTEALPAAELYLLGGGEDGPQVRAARQLLTEGTLASAVGQGATLLAVCAGMQLVGRSFPGSDGSIHQGLGLLELETVRVDAPRAVGEVVVEVTAPSLAARSLPPLTGFENHGGRSRLSPGVEPVGVVRSGVGNGFGGTEGAVGGRVLATYLHGPVLARNPGLADLLLSWALEDDGLASRVLDDAPIEALRAERLG